MSKQLITNWNRIKRLQKLVGQKSTIQYGKKGFNKSSSEQEIEKLLAIGLKKIEQNKESRTASKIQSAWKRYGQGKYQTLVDRLEQIDANPFIFPLQITYKIKGGDNKVEKLLFQSLLAFQSYVDKVVDYNRKGIGEQTVYQFQQVQNFQRPPTDRSKIKRSQHGQGNDFMDCDVIDNELVYIPKSGQCLYECIVKFVGNDQDRTILKTINEYAKKHQIYRHNFRQCDLNKISKLLKIQINYFRLNRNEYRYPIDQSQLCVAIYENHFFIIKDHKNPKKCVDFVKKNLTWTEKQIESSSLSTDIQDVKFHECEDKQLYDNLYIYDLETYRGVQNVFEPYACGYTSMQYIVKDFNKRNYVQIKHGNDCIMQMLLNIDVITKKTKFQIEKGTHKQTTMIKTKVLLMAHNSACFDSYFFLKLEDCKIQKMVQKGGIMSITITSDKFKNADFVVKDTFKFISSPLKALCKSYNVPQHLCKTEMPHDEITAHNYLQMKDYWWDYLINDVLSLSYIWDQFTTKMRQIKMNEKCDIKQYVSIAQLSYSIMMNMTGKKLPFFTDPVVRKFVQKANRGGRVIARTQRFQTQNLDKILELNNVKSIDSLVNTVLHPDSLQLVGQDYQIAFDATSLYPSAMSLEHASYLDASNCQKLTQQQCENFDHKDYEKFIIECDLYIPQSLQFVPISIKTKDGTQFSTGWYKNVVVNDVSLRECFRFGIELKTVYRGIHSKSIKNFMADFVIPLFKERQLVKDADEVLGNLYKLILNSAYGKLGQKSASTEIKFTSEAKFFDKKYDDNVTDYFKLNNGQICYTVKKQIKDEEQQSPHHFAGYVLDYSKQIMNNFVLEMGADKKNLIYYMDTDSFYIHSTIYNKFLSHIKDELGGGKNDYKKTKVIIHADYLACKQKICYVLDTITMKLEKKVTFKGISKQTFSQINQQTVERMKDGSDYMIQSQWQRDLNCGITFGENNISKKMTIESQLQKMNLVDGVYQYRHLE